MSKFDPKEKEQDNNNSTENDNQQNNNEPGDVGVGAGKDDSKESMEDHWEKGRYTEYCDGTLYE